MNKYTVPFFLIALGVFMATDIFPVQDPYMIACLNLCAFLFTISGINLGSIKSRWRNNISTAVRFILQAMALCAFALILLDENFKYYNEFSDFIIGINPNSLLFIGLSATLISIYASQDFNNNQQKNMNKINEELEKKIKTLENHCLVLKDQNVSLKEQKNQLIQNNNDLIKNLQEAIDNEKNDRK